MPWIALTSDAVLARLNNSELSAYQTFRQAPGQSDPLATIISQTVALVRGHVRRTNTLDAGGGIPDIAVGPAADLVIHSLLLRCGAEVSDPRTAANRAALEFLAQIGSGDVRIDITMNPLATATSAPAPSISRPHHRRDTWGE